MYRIKGTHSLGTLWNVIHMSLRRYICLLTKREVNMTGYWPNLLCTFVEGYEVQVNKNEKRKKKTVQYPAILTKQAWSINNILYDQKETFSLAGPMREIPSGKDRPFLPAQVANQNTGFASDSAIQLINKTSCKFPRYCNTPARLLILFSS